MGIAGSSRPRVEKVDRTDCFGCSYVEQTTYDDSRLFRKRLKRERIYIKAKSPWLGSKYVEVSIYDGGSCFPKIKQKLPEAHLGLGSKAAKDMRPLNFGDVEHLQYSKSWTFGEKFRIAGLRRSKGDRLRAERLFEKIPGAVRRDPGRVRDWLSHKDASHIVSHKHGGSGDPHNIIWENRSSNRARGKDNMTPKEAIAICNSDAHDNISYTLADMRRAAAQGAALGASTGALFSLLEQGKECKRGNITQGELATRCGYGAASGAGVGAACGAAGALIGAVAPATTAAVSPVVGALSFASVANRVAYDVDQLLAKESYSPGLFVSERRHEGLFTSETERRGWFSTIVEKSGLFSTSTEIHR